jgi:putative MATE family efflux protein
MDENVTRGVQTLRGDPKKAILKLSGPMMIAMLVQTMYNLVDAIWVSGLGPDALAAVGLFFPFMLFLMGFSNGIGIGGGSAVSRRIGGKNKIAADNTAIHTLFLSISTGFVISLSLLPFLPRIYAMMGATKQVITMSVGYSRIIVSGGLLLFFTNMANNLLRAEGDAKRSMYAIILGAVINIILDPIFIYLFRLGVLGAAWATLISISITAILLFIWLFLKRNTYLSLRLSEFSPDRHIIREILRVGIPASLSMISMSVAMYLLNIIIIKTAGTNGVAIFTSGWRIVSLGTIPLMGIATGVTAVTAASYGEKNPKKLKTAYLYGIQIGILIESIIAITTFIFAGPISYIFTYAEDSKVIADELIRFFHWMAPMYPAVPFGMLTAAMFQGIGKGERAFVVTFIRTIILQVIGSYLLGIVLELGFLGVLWGVLFGNFIAVSISFIWGRTTIKKLCLKLSEKVGDTTQ